MTALVVGAGALVTAAVAAAALPDVQLGLPGVDRVPSRIQVAGRDYEGGGCFRPHEGWKQVGTVWTLADAPRTVRAPRAGGTPTELEVARGECVASYSLLGGP